jgi:hypothetical protein
MVTPSFRRSSLGLVGVAEGADAIAAHPAVVGRFQLARQGAVVGQQQQAFGVQVQTSHRDQARQLARQGLEHRRAFLGVVVGGHQPGGLVIAEHAGRLALGHQLAVDGQEVAGRDLDRRGGQHLAVDGDATVLDQPLDLAPRGHARPGQGLGDPRAVDGSSRSPSWPGSYRGSWGVLVMASVLRRAGRISRWAFLNAHRSA